MNYRKYTIDHMKRISQSMLEKVFYICIIYRWQFKKFFRMILLTKNMFNV